MHKKEHHEKEEVKGGEHSHDDHKKHAMHHHKEMSKHISALHKMAKAGHKHHKGK
jgi:hypothetical protein